ncbi:hypothetical protein [Cryptosporangium aurantiacum]|uniref:Uncharacterized protein n=1 Tax=Cryptosporangium aurantiacum TaxID=134849 RepID=A0A1M7PTF1_9ACTN|nr:hypothetical protein [Cryptosporangium aurantiacum]SHN20620.1 hypothetical protein SAMN05443668_103656 [Cryptosporangium aurantiacum]
MALEFERAPAGSECTREKVLYPKNYSDHQPAKYRLKVGTGSSSNVIRCVACSYPAEREAMQTVDRLDDGHELVQLAAEMERLRRSPGQRLWPWALLAVGGGGALLLTWWLVAGVVGLVALLAFAFFVPVPCRSTVEDDPEPCKEWARGFLRACPDRRHARRQRELLREAWRGQDRPRLIWEDRMTRGAIVGAWASLALIAFASGCYLSTVLF